jgi:hypothetical protein
MQALEWAIDPYLRASPFDDPTLVQRALRQWLIWTLSDLRRSPLHGPSWYRPIANRLGDLMRFATERPTTWARWIRR